MAAELIHLTASGVSLVLDVGGGRLPRVVHWGAALGDLDEAGLAAVARATAEPLVGGEFDQRHALSVLPEHSWGWMHTPGVAGSRAGRDHSTRFENTSVEAYARAGGGAVADGAVQGVVVTASDAVAELRVAV